MTLLTKPVRLSKTIRISLKCFIHIIALGYLIALFYAGITDNLGPDPVETLLNETGIWAIHLLLLTLALSPLAKWLPSAEPIKFRRLIGVYSFVYAVAHLSTYLLFELQLDMSLISSELIKRPYIAVGFTAFLLLLLLSITSLSVVRKKMGKRWQQLHNAVYLVLLLVLLHFTWSQKTLWQEPIWYWLVAIFLLSGRAVNLVLKTRKKWKRNAQPQS